MAKAVSYDIMSIRVTAGGLYFSGRRKGKWRELKFFPLLDDLTADGLRGMLAECLGGGALPGKVAVEYSGAKTTLVPSEHFSPGLAARFLSICGRFVGRDEETVWSDEGARIVAVMAVPRHLTDTLKEALPAGFVYSSPLLALVAWDEKIKPRGSYLLATSDGPLVHLAVRKDGKLLAAETLAADSDTARICLMQTLATRHRLGKPKAIAFNGSETFLRTIRGYFGKPLRIKLFPTPQP